VEQLHAERHRDAEPREDERRRRDERGVECGAAAERVHDEQTEGVQRRVVRDQQHHRHQDEREDDRPDRDRERQPARLRQAALDADHSRDPPAIRRPSSSTVASSAETSPTTAPSYSTAIRSASARISSRSSEIRRTPTPPDAAVRRCSCTVSIAATSSPLVGEATTSTRGCPSNSRPSTTFCRFPPESWRAGRSGPPPRTSYSRIRRSACARIVRSRSSGPKENLGLSYA